jgi:DNA-binding MarR family transcriptional regulator
LTERELLDQGRTEDGPVQYGAAELTLAEPGLASGLAAAIERLIVLFRSLSPANGLSLTAAATLATLERSGPCRLTWLAVREGVTQPAMTQLIGRLQDAGLVERIADASDGRVVQVRLTADGKATLAGRRAVRADRLAGLLAKLSLDDQHALAAALPALEALASTQRAGPAGAAQDRAGQYR